MPYVEMLRVRRGLTVYVILVVVIAALVSASMHAARIGDGGHSAAIVINGSQGQAAPGSAPGESISEHLRGVRIPLSSILVAAVFFASIFATTLASSLNKERDNLYMTFTKPISRPRLALGYFAVDALGVLLAYAVAVAAILAPIASLGLLGAITSDGMTPLLFVFGIGVTLMWYGSLQAATAWYSGKGGVIVGLSWPAFFILLVLGSYEGFGPIVHALVVALDYINPLVYFASLMSDANGHANNATALGLPLQVRVLVVYVLGAAGCAIAVFSWKRIEV